METTNSNSIENMEDHILDSAWGDDDADDFGVDTGDEAGQAPADQQEEGAQGGEDNQRADQSKADPTAQPPELFTIKNRDETRQVTREELIAMAQKGWDYDNVRQERDQLRQYREQNDPALNYLTAHAQRQGMDVRQWLQQAQKQELMNRGMSEQEADRELEYRQRKADLDNQQAVIDAHNRQKNSEAEQAKARQEAIKREVTSFMKAYPELKPTDIPKEVWTQVQQGVSMVGAYAMYENQQLKAELAAERQNKSNAQRTPGSMNGNKGPEMDEIDRYWADDDD